MAGPDWRAGHLAIVVTADEDDHHQDNLVLTAVAHPSLHGAVVTTPLSHYSLARLYSEVVAAAAARRRPPPLPRWPRPSDWISPAAEGRGTSPRCGVRSCQRVRLPVGSATLRLEQLYRIRFTYPESWVVGLEGGWEQHLMIAEGRCEGQISGRFRGCELPAASDRDGAFPSGLPCRHRDGRRSDADVRVARLRSCLPSRATSDRRFRPPPQRQRPLPPPQRCRMRVRGRGARAG